MNRLPHRSSRTRRRGAVLVEMMTILFVFGITGTVLITGLISLRDSQERVGYLDNRVAVTHDLLKCLERDVRAATVCTLTTDLHGRSQLLLTSPNGQTVYTTHDLAVHRSPLPVDQAEDRSVTQPTAEKHWTGIEVVFQIAARDQASPNTLVHAEVSWPYNPDEDPLRPERRFQSAFRCMGELRHDED